MNLMAVSWAAAISLVTAARTSSTGFGWATLVVCAETLAHVAIQITIAHAPGKLITPQLIPKRFIVWLVQKPSRKVATKQQSEESREFRLASSTVVAADERCFSGWRKENYCGVFCESGF